MRAPLCRVAALALFVLVPAHCYATAAAQDADALRVFLRAGPKTHGPGEHDHPRFLDEWTRLLRARGAVAHGAQRFPSADELAQTDVIVFYAAEGASIRGDERARLDAFLARGGGLVVLHDAVCGDDPRWFETVAGGAWEHGRSQWHTGEIGLYFTHEDHPITRGVANFDLTDEIYHELHLAPEARVLANSFHTPFDVTPQMWTYEKSDYRAFVSLQGHYHDTFSHPAWRALVLRGIAWAAKRDVDLLVTPDEVAGLRYPPGGPTAPERAAESFELHPDFEASLVAAEPLVVNPISLDWDADGRMWVALTPGYPHKEQHSGIPAHDEIAILRDEDGDGRMDAKTVFHRGLDLVTSLVHHADGVIVSAAPDILWLRDTDGDDACDTVETLYTGFGWFDTHAVVSNMRQGLDGWIYATQGYSGNESRDVRGKERFGHVPGGLLRFRPDGSAIETISSYGSNTWGLDFAEDEELFFTMANGAHLRHVVVPEDALTSRVNRATSFATIVDHDELFPAVHHARDVYRQIDFVGGFTAASGCLVYSGGAWPDAFRGNHFVCEPTVNLVHRDVLRREGATFRASKPRDAEFLASRDLWFRPVHLRTGPDGALYVLDFYNQAVVHNDTRGPEHGPTNAAVRADRDRMHGRIWRIDHRASDGHALAPLGGAPAGTLVSMLEHPNAWQRSSAARLLRESARADDFDATAALAGLARDSALPAARIAALWTLHETPAARYDVAARVALLAVALADQDAGVRRNAARIAGLTQHRGALSEQLIALAVAPGGDARVRLAALRALHPVADANASNLIARSWSGYDDDWTRSVALATMAAQPLPALASAVSANDAELCAHLATALARSRPSLAAGAVELVATLSAEPDVAASFLSTLARELRPLDQPSPTPELVAALDRLLAHESAAVAIAALPLAARWRAEDALAERVAELSSRLARLAAAPDAEPSERLRAVRALLAAGADAPLDGAAALLSPLYPIGTQLAVIEALAESEHPRAGAVLADAFARLAPAGRDAAFEALVRRPERAAELIERIEDGDVRLVDLGPHRAHRLGHHPDRATAEYAREVLAPLRPDTGTTDELIETLLPLVEAPGDPERGRALFAQQCGTCHAVGGEGGDVGPELTGMGAHGRAALLPFLVDPNREVDPAYLEYVAETASGELFAGVLVRETKGAIVLRSTAGEREIRRDELVELASTGRSPMPTGFGELGADVLRDILAYLEVGAEGLRVLDLASVATATTERSLYGPDRDETRYRFRRFGILDAGGTPFELPDPARARGGKNVLVLNGGPNADWPSRTDLPKSVDVQVGLVVERVHVLGGVAGWGHPWGSVRDQPALRWTWNYSDGEREEVVLYDGREFADWIGRYDVPGSEHVPGLLEDGSYGQVRRFALAPSRAVEVASITLASCANHLAPTVLALTAELPGARTDGARHVIVGGGSSHDFERWLGREDVATLEAALDVRATYTGIAGDVARLVSGADVVALANNQPLPAEARAALFEHVGSGGGLVVVHAAAWHNWADWPEYNARLVGGGARSHERYGTFRVDVERPEHPLMAGVPASFEVADELYRFERDERGAPIEVLARGTSLETGASFPVVWTVDAGAGRVVVITLGHDGGAHEHPAFRTLLANAFRWADAAEGTNGGER